MNTGAIDVQAEEEGHIGKDEQKCISVLTMTIAWHPCLHHDRNILIDCGKSYYESARQWFPVHNIDHIDALVRDTDSFQRPSLFVPMHCGDTITFFDKRTVFISPDFEPLINAP